MSIIENHQSTIANTLFTRIIIGNLKRIHKSQSIQYCINRKCLSLYLFPRKQIPHVSLPFNLSLTYFTLLSLEQWYITFIKWKACFLNDQLWRIICLTCDLFISNRMFKHFACITGNNNYINQNNEVFFGSKTKHNIVVTNIYFKQTMGIMGI